VPRRDNEKGGEAHVTSERRTEEEEDEEVELHMPGWFEFEDHDTGAARVGTVDRFDAVGMLGKGTCGGGCRWDSGADKTNISFVSDDFLPIYTFTVTVMILVL
jgi:hypothetical protein